MPPKACLESIERLIFAPSKTLANVRFWGIAALDLTANKSDFAAMSPIKPRRRKPLRIAAQSVQI